MGNERFPMSENCVVAQIVPELARNMLGLRSVSWWAVARL